MGSEGWVDGCVGGRGMGGFEGWFHSYKRYVNNDVGKGGSAGVWSLWSQIKVGARYSAFLLHKSLTDLNPKPPIPEP